MHGKPMNKLYLSSIVLIAIIGLGSCSGYDKDKPGMQLVKPALEVRVDNQSRLTEISSLAISPIVSTGAPLSLADEKFIQNALETDFAGRLSFEVQKGDLVLTKLGTAADTAQKLKKAAEIGADALLVTHVHRYQKRIGSTIGVTQPASVDFRISVISVASKTELWNASYFFRDEALSENLFRISEHLHNIKNKKGWLSADDILRAGMKQSGSALSDMWHKAYTGE